MAPRIARYLAESKPTSRLLAALSLVLLTSSGCGLLPYLLDGTSLVGGETELNDGTSITADVTAVSQTTAMPTTLSGTLSGEYTGTYEEEILEVFFDSNGAPIAGLSRSQFTIEGDDAGTLTTLNLIVVSALIPQTDAQGTPVLDAQGDPVVIGLESAASGEIVYGTGAFAGATGKVHTDSDLFFTGGSADLGSLDADLTIVLETDAL